MQAAAEELATTTATEAEKLCTHKIGENPDGTPIYCGKPATHAYSWPWGESGKCCPEHHFILQQVSEQIARPVSFTPLDSGIMPPLETDERIQFNARILTLEQELDVARKRGAELYNTNTKLAEEGRLLMAKLNDCKERLESKHREVVGLEERNGKLLSNNAELTEEVERLRAFLPSEDHA